MACFTFAPDVFTPALPQMRRSVAVDTSLEVAALMSVTIVGGAALQPGVFCSADADLPGTLVFWLQTAGTIVLDGAAPLAVPGLRPCLCRAEGHVELRHQGGRLVMVVLPDTVVRRAGVALPMAGILHCDPDRALEILLAQAQCLLGLEASADLALACEESLVGLLSRSAPCRHDADSQGVARRRAPQFSDIVRFVATRFVDPELGIDDLARHYAVSRRTVQKVIQEHGTTFIELLARRRLEAAHALVGDPDQGRRKISDIALDCGFNDISTFNRVFRRHFGRTPSAIRQKAGLRAEA